MTVMQRPLLAVDRLTVRFSGVGTAAVDAVSFALNRGETLGLVGESGSGKSLSALSILGLTPVAARVEAEGGIRWRGRRIDGDGNPLLARLRGRRIGIVFQEPAGCLNPLIPIGRQIGEAIPRRGAKAEKIAALLAETGLAPEHAARYPHELSGGQQQRAMIAMALAGDPDLLIADEPTTALDVTVQAQIVELLRALRRKRGMALLFISHDLALVAALADRVAVMRHGRILEDGPTRSVFLSPQHAYTHALLAARPMHGTPPSRLPTIDDVSSGAEAAAAARPEIGADVLSVETLVVDYPGRGWLGRPMRAVAGVDLTLAAGETLGVVGESGSGKSTIGKAILGLVRPTAGRIALFGEDLPAGRAPGHRRCQIVFQDSHGSLNPRLAVARNLGEPLDLRGLYPRNARRPRLEALMAEVRLPAALLDRYPHELSGGQRQRINIARALALDPDMLVCDEIVSALDVTVQAQVLNLLKDLQAERGLALLFISHDLAVVRFMADRIAVMKDGRIVETGAAGDILDRPQHAYTRALMAAIPQADTAEAA